VVALVSSATPGIEATRRRELGWTLGAVGVLIVGLAVRVVLGGAGIGDRSAIVITTLLSVGCWVGARLLAGPRVGVLILAAVVVLLDIAALPPRNAPIYDDVQAFYRPDQELRAQLPVAAGVDRTADVAVTLLVQPVFDSGQPRFGLAGEVNGAPLEWTCAFGRGIQRIGLALPVGALVGATSADVRLHLTGEPSRDGDYLLVYASSRLGGFVISLDPAATVDPSVTRCVLV
jgi:hypothetical protein